MRIPIGIGALLALLIASNCHAQVIDSAELQKSFQRHFNQGDWAAALGEARRLEALVKAKVGIRHPAYAAALSNIADALAAQGQAAEAETTYKTIWTLRERTAGPNSVPVAATLTDLGTLYSTQGRYKEAEALFKRVLAISEKTLGRDALGTAVALNNLANVEQNLGNHALAEPLFRRALPIYQKELGPTSAETAKLTSNLASLYDALGRYDQAESLYQTAAAAFEQALKPSDPALTQFLVNWAASLRERGRYGDARAMLERAKQITETSFGQSHAAMVPILNNLGNLDWVMGRLDQAEAMFSRALAIQEQRQGASSHDVAVMLSNLAGVYRDEKRLSEAAMLYSRAANILKSVTGDKSPAVAHVMVDLAIIDRDQGRYREAQSAIDQALAIREAGLGADHPDVADALVVAATIDRAQARFRDAEQRYQRAAAIVAKAFGPSHPALATIDNNWAAVQADQGHNEAAAKLQTAALTVAQSAFGEAHPALAQYLNNLAVMTGRRGDVAGALSFSRRSSAILLAQPFERTGGSQRDANRYAEFIGQREALFQTHLTHIAAAARANLEAREALENEAFVIAQSGAQSSSAAAVQQMSTRFASGAGVLADMVRRDQDLAAQWQAANNTLISLLSKPAAATASNRIRVTRAQILAIEQELSEVTGRLRQEFPRFAQLTSPKPVAIGETQKLLQSDEALIFFSLGRSETYVWAVTSDAVRWRVAEIGAEKLQENIGRFRRGLDLTKLIESIDAGQPELFDLGLASSLYRDLLSGVEDLIDAKRHWIIVPTGALTALPFDLLLTEEPTHLVARAEDIPLYRNAAWLIRRHSVSVLPSVGSLQALRVVAQTGPAQKPITGYANPDFSGGRGGPPGGVAQKTAAARQVRSYADYWNGAGVDRERLRQSLPPLPETETELKAIASRLGADPGDIYLGGEATEAAVKTAPLSDYRIVYFATHGLVAGDVKGMAEPALALSIPSSDDGDDGLLTASEVAQLKMNADWVVLSACNTAAGGKPGAQAFSGLASAFFYAGVRGLLVSHWSVDSTAAARLTIALFTGLQTDPALNRAEALRRAMLSYLNDTSDAWNAYPALWGPFTIVGEVTTAANKQ